MKFLSIFALAFGAHLFALGQIGIAENKPMKRGKEYQLFWTTSTDMGERMNIQLMKDKAVIQTWDDVAKSGSKLIKIPSRLRPGRYSFHLTNEGQNSQIIQGVKVKRRIRLLVKLLTPVVLFPVALIISSSLPQESNLADMPSAPPNLN